MQLDRCRSCGGELERVGNSYVCKFCGSKWVIDADQDIHVIDRANAWSALRDCDFEHAGELFENIIYKEPKNHEAYWGRALANAGIMYVTDFHENKKVPTCNSISESSFIDSRDVKRAIELAPADIAESYRAQAEQIEAIRVEWVKKASREPAYDIFISYKDSDREHHIERTEDSYDAHELYMALTEAGYKVFFSRVSLRNKVSEHYEPYIYNAIKTAKVMIVYGEKPEYFNAVWIKNEWMRFRKRIELGEKHQNSLVVAYKGLDPADLPIGLRSRQCIDASSITFLEDLKKHIDKIIRKPEKAASAVKVDEPAATVEVPEKKKSKKGIIIAAIAAVLAVCIGVGFIVMNLADGDGKTTPVLPHGTELVTLPTDKETETQTETETESPTESKQETASESESEAHTNSYDIGDPGDYTYSERLETVYVNNPGLAITLRKANYESIGSISHGTELLRIGVSTDEANYWSKVIYNELECYVASKFLTTLKDADEGFVAVDKIVVVNEMTGDLNIRNLPTFDGSTIIGHLRAGVETKVIAENTETGWYKIEFNPYSGGVEVGYITSDPTYFIENESTGGYGDTESEAISETATENETAISTEEKTDEPSETELHVCNFSDWEIIKCATCTEKGTRERSCECGEIQTESIDELGHEIIEHEAKDPTCVNVGWDAYISCSLCGYTTYVEKSATSLHIYNAENTCTACGDYADKGVVFRLLGEEYAVADYTGSESTVVIPSKYKGYPVTSIAMCAFQDCTSLTSVVIPDSVTSIEMCAFQNCTSLKSVVIGDSVTSIGSWAFDGSTSLTSVVMPAFAISYIPRQNLISVTISSGESIGHNAFENCSRLTSVSIPDSITSIGHNAFEGCTSLTYNEYDNAYYLGNEANPYVVLVKAKNTDITSCKIHSDTKIISDDAFNRCYEISSVVIPDNVTSIGSSAFYDCFITNLEIPDSVTRIGESAFEACDILTSVTIGDSVESIGERAFEGCTSLTSVVIPDSVTNICESTFENCTSLASVVIGDSVTSIGDSAFYGCTSLTSVVIPDSVKNIGFGAFKHCTSLTSVTIGNGVTSIEMSYNVTSGDSAFFGCSSLTSIIVDEENADYKSIDGNLYSKDGKTLIQYATGKTDTAFVIPDGVMSIGNTAFRGSSLTSVVIPDSVTSVGFAAFSHCNSLASVVIPDSVTGLYDRAFENCTSLTSVVIGDSVNSIVLYAFYDCYKLIEVYNLSDLDITVGSSLNGYVGYYAKNVYTETSGASKLVEKDGYIFYTDEENNEYYLMGYVGEDTELVLPDDIYGHGYTIYQYAFYNQDDLTSVEIPDGVTRIENCAFSYCDGLTSVTFKNPNGWWYASYSGATSGTSILSSSLASESTAAMYLKSTYCDYDWNRS